MVAHMYRMIGRTLALTIDIRVSVNMIQSDGPDFKCSPYERRGCLLDLIHSKLLAKKEIQLEVNDLDTQVSHKMGNSLCSQPALLMSALGGIISRCFP